jgi:hypothetical protein
MKCPLKLKCVELAWIIKHESFRHVEYETYKLTNCSRLSQDKVTLLLESKTRILCPSEQ